MADEDVCVAVGEDLTRAFPGYFWMVGCNHEAGTIQIDLPGQKPIGMERWGMLLHISTVLGAGGQKAVMRAGGEMLERLGLRRGAAHADTNEIALAHGLDTGNAVLKSRH
jgi:hypothetical protein